MPTEISESIAMPTSQIIVTLRNSNNIVNMPLEGWFTEDIAILCSKFQVRTMNYSHKVNQIDNISDSLQRELK